MPRPKKPKPSPPSPAEVKAAADRALVQAANKAGNPDRQAAQRIAVLSTLRKGWSLAKAAERAGISRQTIFRWRKDDPDFDTEVLEAIEHGVDTLEDHMTDMAIGGEDGSRPKQFLPLVAQLKARRPERYRENVRVESSATVTHHVPGEIFAAAFATFAEQAREAATREMERRRLAQGDGPVIIGTAAELKAIAPPGVDPTVTPPTKAEKITARIEQAEAEHEAAKRVNPAGYTQGEWLAALQAQQGTKPLHDPDRNR